MKMKNKVRIKNKMKMKMKNKMRIKIKMKIQYESTESLKYSNTGKIYSMIHEMLFFLIQMII